MAELGRTNRLVIVRDSDHGFYLDGEELGEILLPTREVPEDVEQGDEVEVFLMRDSEDRLIATSQKPWCEVGDFAALEVKSVHPKVGAFLDWGMPKDLLLPFREQLGRVKEGQLVIVRVLLDKVSDRIVATARTNRFLNQTFPPYGIGEEVSLIVQERTPLGYLAIVNQRHRGLLHESHLRHPLQIGEELSGYIAKVKEDGKIDLSLDAVGYGRVTNLSDRILEELQQAGGELGIGDKSSPEEIRNRFDTSKKAFKQALGALYRDRKIVLEPNRISLVDE